jgi:hypothetical protein
VRWQVGQVKELAVCVIPGVCRSGVARGGATVASPGPIQNGGAVTVKSFTSAAKKKAGKKKADITFALDGEKYAVRGEVKDASFGTVSAVAAIAIEAGDMAKAGASMIELIQTLFTTDTSTRLLKRLKDPDDDLTLEKVGEIIEWAVEQHTGERPTTSR